MSSNTNLPSLRRNDLETAKSRRYSQKSVLNGANTPDVAADTASCHSGMELITYVFPDFKAVEYFQKEFVLADEFHVAEITTAAGFEIYLIDQWIRSRKIGSFISVFTGNHESIVSVVKFTVAKKPADQYPPRFQEYLNELVLNHATFKKMTLAGDSAGLSIPSESENQLNEYLLVTNLTAFPHNLNLIAVTNGDSRPAIPTYMVNSNLRMFHCGGRSLSLLSESVSDACAGRFRQMYRVNNESVPVDFAILELVNLVQTCLFYFDLLDAKYADGLLCQKTEDAIQNWWNLIGLPIFNMKPDTRSGVLSSKTVSAIISLTVSVKLRLQMFGGCDVPKDPFDFENFMLSIGQFQKQTGLEKKRKLDLVTLLRLFHYTNTGEQTKQMYSGFDSEAMFQDLSEQAPGLGLASPNPNLSSLSLPNASAYRKNRIHYSKELKKLTNVVKNTVQDRINPKDDTDDLLASSLTNKSSNKLRNKIASKLNDTLTPADVETTDIDVFVKKSLIGKTLVRLWIGWSSASKIMNQASKDGDSSTLVTPSLRNHIDGYHHHHRLLSHHHQHHHSYNHNKGSDFTFVSFRDAVYANLASLSGTPRKHGRLRFGFQNRAQTKMSTYENFYEDTYSPHENVPATDGSSVIANALNRKASILTESINSFKAYTSDLKSDCFHVLNRRGSFPFICSGHELGLNTIEFVKSKDAHANISLRKCASFSSLESLVNARVDLVSSERIRINYVNQTTAIMATEGRMVSDTTAASKKLEKQFEQTNFELVRLHNICFHMEQRKKAIDSDHFNILEGKMNDLADNIDRMSFRARDLTKKVTELELNVKNFDHKVETGAVEKLDAMTVNIVNSAKFKKVFKDEQEMRKMYALLTGKEYDPKVDGSSNDPWRLQVFAVFVYEFVVTILQFLRFDRSRMNLDRIREQYYKIDPGREFINRMYKIVGASPPEPEIVNIEDKKDQVDVTNGHL